IPGYEVQRRLGSGGMGVVYLARQVALNRLVALKVMRPHSAGHELRERFRAEARPVARLEHPNIVRVHDSGAHEDQLYFAPEYVAGGCLAEKLSGGPWPARQAAELVACLADAVEHAHQQGIVHRDLKPANVLLTEQGEPKVADFGLSRQQSAEAGLTRSGDVL